MTIEWKCDATPRPQNGCHVYPAQPIQPKVLANQSIRGIVLFVRRP
jgi:hypothetical protein